MYHKILIPLDGSSLAELALAHAEALAHRFESELLLVRVCPPVSSSLEFYTFGEESGVENGNQDLQAQAEKTAEAYLSALQEKLRLKDIRCNYFVLHRSVPEAILEMAKAEAVDLIIMCTHGRSGLSSWVYGSVAAKILQAAPCPIFLIRARLEK